MARRRAGGDVLIDVATPVARELRLADGTPGEAFERLATAIDRGAVTITEAKLLSDILDKRLRVMDAERFRQRLELAEAQAREAVRQVALPARKAMVDIGGSLEGDQT